MRERQDLLESDDRPGALRGNSARRKLGAALPLEPDLSDLAECLDGKTPRYGRFKMRRN